MKEKDIPLFYTTTVSTTVVYSFLYMIYIWLLCFTTIGNFLDKFGTVAVVVFLGFLNYFLFVRPRKFLAMGFEKTNKGGVLIVSILVIIAVGLVLSMNYYRNEILGL